MNPSRDLCNRANRLTYMKNPETGKRVSKLNPEEDWIIHDVPELQLIDEEVWQAAKDRQRKLDRTGGNFWSKQRPRNLFSGLIKCGECGGGFSMVSQTHMGCSNARNKGTCSNKKTMKRENLEQDVLGALEHYLMDDELCNVFCEEYTRHMNKLRREHDAALDFHRDDLRRVKKHLTQMVDAIAEGAPVAPIKDKMHELENRRVHLEALLKDVEEAPPLLHPSMARRYREQLGKLFETLNTPEHRAEATEIVRSLVEKIVLTPDESENRLVADLHGDLAGILTLSAGPKPSSHINDATIAASRAALGEGPTCESAPEGASQDKLVAGGRSKLNLRGSQDKLVAGARSNRSLLCKTRQESVVEGTRSGRPLPLEKGQGTMVAGGGFSRSLPKTEEELQALAKPSAYKTFGRVAVNDTTYRSLRSLHVAYDMGGVSMRGKKIESI